MDYDTALLTGAQVVSQTGDTDLANLAADAELVLDTFVLAAHRDVYRRLSRRGIDPTAISNEAWLKDAVAYMATARLAQAGHLERPDERQAFAVEQLDNFVPTYASTTATPRMAGEGIPSVSHASDGLVYGMPSSPSLDEDYKRTNIPLDLG